MKTSWRGGSTIGAVPYYDGGGGGGIPPPPQIAQRHRNQVNPGGKEQRALDPNRHTQATGGGPQEPFEGRHQERQHQAKTEAGEGREEFIPMLQQMAGHMDKAYCAFAPGAAESVLGLLKYFLDEVREHISQKKCPFEKAYRPYRELWYPPE